jgi:hypothetical protein
VIQTVKVKAATNDTNSEAELEATLAIIRELAKT